MKLTTLFWLGKLGDLAFFALLILGITLTLPVLTVIGIVIVVAVAVIYQWKYRCPYCHKALDSRKLTPEKVCHHCGGRLR